MTDNVKQNEKSEVSELYLQYLRERLEETIEDRENELIKQKETNNCLCV